MADAGITNPESHAGIDFCVNECPYDHCVVVEPILNEYHSYDRARRRHHIAIKMRQEGRSYKEIATVLRLTERTVFRYLHNTPYSGKES